MLVNLKGQGFLWNYFFMEHGTIWDYLDFLFFLLKSYLLSILLKLSYAMAQTLKWEDRTLVRSLSSRKYFGKY